MVTGRDRARAVDKALRGGPLTEGQKAAVKLILASDDPVVGVQGYAGSGKTTMLNRARALLEKRGYEVRGLAPSASAARMTAKGEKEMRAAFAKTVLVVDEGRSPPPSRHGTCSGSRTGCASPAWCWWATRSSSTPSMRASPSRNSRPPA